MNPLPILVASGPCSDCPGACCSRAGTPPGFFAFYPPDPSDAARLRALSWGDDAAFHDSAPPEAREVLASYYRDLRAGLTPDRVEAEMPCLWLDGETGRCRWHGHRPEICRDFEAGGEDCGDWRRDSGLPAIPPAADRGSEAS